MRYLVAVDTSEQAVHAVRALGHLASPERIVVLHALYVPLAVYPGLVPQVAQDLYCITERGMREEGERLLSGAMAMLPPGIGATETRIQVGPRAQVIVSTAAREGVDLIILGTRGASRIKEIVLGSVSHRVLAHAPCAVLTVPSPLRELRKVLLAVKGHEDASTAMRFLLQKPFKEPVDIDVLTVLPFTHERAADATESERLKEMALRSAHRFVEDIAGRLSVVKGNAIPRAKVGAPADTILHHAEEYQSDLIVIGSDTGPSPPFLLGSVSHKVLHSARRPVLTLR